MWAGLATAFASSFANRLIIGTPNNTIVYSIAKEPMTGEHLLTRKHFLIHGAVVLVLNSAVLWFWVISGNKKESHEEKIRAAKVDRIISHPMAVFSGNQED